jgi:hypothetical protein
MTIELVLEANNLYQTLNDLMWQESVNRNVNRYYRIERISGNALKRWERRYKKWEELQTSSLS